MIIYLYKYAKDGTAVLVDYGVVSRVKDYRAQGYIVRGSMSKKRKPLGRYKINKRKFDKEAN